MDLAELWTTPDLLLAQTCSLPFRLDLKDWVWVVGAFDYGVEGCPPGTYRSILVARADDTRDTADAFAGAALAYNEAKSQSGWAAVWMAGLTALPRLATGAHLHSAEAVAEGRADLAALDAVTWRLLTQHRPGLTASLKVIGRTDPTPGLPLITAFPDHVDTLRSVLGDVALRAPAETGIVGFVPSDAARYRALPIPPDPVDHARALGERQA